LFPLPKYSSKSLKLDFRNVITSGQPGERLKIVPSGGPQYTGSAVFCLGGCYGQNKAPRKWSCLNKVGKKTTRAGTFWLSAILGLHEYLRHVGVMLRD
jgi:hypothetical protein